MGNILLVYFKIIVIAFFVGLYVKWTTSDELGYRCDKVVQQNSIPLCTGRYPASAKALYNDLMAATGLLYSVYIIGGNEGNYFITHGTSDLNSCKQLKVISHTEFVCNDKSVTLTTKSRVNCIPYKLRLVDALVANCAPKAMLCSNYSVMHYVDVSPKYIIALNLDETQFYRNSQDVLHKRFNVIFTIIIFVYTLKITCM